MKMCQKHWDQLREAIDTRGLSHLIHQSGEAAAEALMSQLNGTATDADYDPLLNANNMIMGNALQCGGLYLLGADENGNDYCPLCEVDKHTGQSGHTAEVWITDSADAALLHCQEHGLTVPKQ